MGENVNQDWRLVHLPSRGLPYGGRVPNGAVEVGVLGTEEEEIVANPASVGKRNLVDAILENIVRCPVPLRELLLGDRLFLLLYTRLHSYGENWTFSWKCENCGKQMRDTVLISQLPLLRPPEDQTEWSEPFELHLPNGDTIKWRHLRGSDEASALRYADQIRNKGGGKKGDPAYRYRKALSLVEVNGEAPENIGEALKYVVNKLKGEISLAYADALEDNRIGVDLDREQDCVHCGWLNELTIKFDLTEFFRPRRRSG